MDYLSYIDKNKNRLIGLAKALIDIPTVNPPGDKYEKIAGFLESYCRKLGLPADRIVVGPKALAQHGISEGSKRINLLCRWNVNSKKTLHFNGHYDVVPPTSNWNTEPFKSVLKGGKIYGRGSEDMKGTIASMIFAAEALKACGNKPALNIEFSFTADEETGGKTGLGYLVKRNLVRPDFAIGEGYSDEFVSSANKGLLWIKIEVYGKSGHSSKAYGSVSAFDNTIKLTNKLNILRKRIEKRKTRYATRNAKDAFSSIAIATTIKGGSKINTLCDNVTFTVDRRFLPDEGIGNVKSEIADIISALKRKDKTFKARLTILSQEKPIVVSAENPLARIFSQAISKVYHKNARFALMAGATDMRYFAYKGITAMGYGVAGGQRCHGDNEFIYIKSLVKTAKVFAFIMKNFSAQ